MANAPKASSLITTLLVLVVLSTIVVAFMQSMSVERSVARSTKNAYQAQLAAEAGVSDALSRLSQLMVKNPYHAIGYTNVSGQTVSILTGSTSYTNTTPPVTYYLLSVTNPTNMPSGLNKTNATAINLPTSDGAGWLGSPVASNGILSSRECRAPWVYLLKDPSLPHQPNQSAANYNPYVARYAYWIEDESSKLDFRMAGNNNASGGFQRSTNAGAPSDIDLGAAPLVNGKAISTSDSSANNALITFRDSVANLPVDGRRLGQAAGVFSNAAKTSRFYVTMASYGNNLSGTGQRRININALVTDTNSASGISADLDDLIYSISGTHAYPGAGGKFNALPDTNGPLPSFGSRFYTGVSSTNQAIYLKKIAANIRDYIDADSLPTLVDTTGAVAVGVSGNWWNSWPPQALGKEAIPYLQETAWAGYEVDWNIIIDEPSKKISQATIEIDHYLEFFNPSTKDFVAPQGTEIQFSDGPYWEAGVFSDLEIPDFSIDISGVIFPAGKVTVITTNPGPLENDPPGLILDEDRLVRIAPNPLLARRFENILTSNIISGSSSEGDVAGFQSSKDSTGQQAARDSTVADNQSHLLIVGLQGVYDAFSAYGYTGTVPNYWNFKGQNKNERKRFVYSSSLMGNNANGRSGDPRTINEQLMFAVYSSKNQDNTRFYGNIQGNSKIPDDSTFGKAALSFVDPKKNQGTVGAWGDYNPAFDDTKATAFNIIRDGNMTSIGELGNIFDPYRLACPTGIDFSRGGGRSLKVGQPDDVIGSATRFSTNWQNAAWRLVDIFGVNASKSILELDPVQRGQVNVNSVMRDGGTVLRSLLRQFVFLPDSAKGIAGSSLSDSEISNLILSLSNYVSTNGPFMERGEISQIGYFSGASANTNKIAGQNVSTTADRGREEIFRRMVELITTRSSSFSIFCVGEAIQESSTGTIKPLAKSNQGAVYRFDPNMSSGLRAKVTNYTATKLYEME